MGRLPKPNSGEKQVERMCLSNFGSTLEERDTPKGRLEREEANWRGEFARVWSSLGRSLITYMIAFQFFDPIFG